MLDRKHPAFKPPSSNCQIWRYLDFTKFVSLLETQKLVFPRSDLFDDPYEGAFSIEAIRQLRAALARDKYDTKAVDQYVNSIPFFKSQMYISCWHASDHESAAMWKIYLQSPEGVAIRSDCDALSAALEKSSLMARISMVQYVNYEKVAIPLDNAFFPFLHKRLSFAHENELRAVIWSAEDQNQRQIPPESKLVAVDVRPDELVKAAHISPNAPQWFGALVEQVVRRYGCGIPVVRSNLYDRPTY
jgi:hypothetical protein